MLAKRYDGETPSINLKIKGLMLSFLTFPLLIAVFFALASGDVRKLVFNLVAYLIYFFGIRLAKKGFEEEKKYKESKLAFAPKKKYKMLGALTLGVGTFVASLFCVDNSLVSSIILSIATIIGFIFYYGLDPSEDKVDTTMSKSLQDAIEVINEVKQKLNELKKIKYFDKNIQEDFTIIISEISDMVNKVEDEPNLLSKVRKFFKVYLSRVVEISSEYAKYKDIDKDVEERYKWLLKDLKNTIVEQKKLLEKKDLEGLDIQIESLSKQLKNEGVEL